MSSFSEVAIVFAIGVACVYLYFWLDRLIKDQANAIVTGAVGGAPLPTKSRGLMLYTSWFSTIGLGVSWEVAQAMVWIVVVGGVANAREARFFAYMAAFMASVAAIRWFLEAVVLYPYLRSLVRQTEAD